MGFGDVGDDGQAETQPVRAGGPVRASALERLEEAAELIWRHKGAGVGNGERRTRRAGCKLHLETSAGDVVADGVVDEVRHQPVEEAVVPWNLGIIEGGLDL